MQYVLAIILSTSALSNTMFMGIKINILGTTTAALLVPMNY